MSNYGQGIAFVNLAKPTGAPFTNDSALNGTSIGQDPLTNLGKITFGEPLGGVPGEAATLLYHTKIPMNNFLFRFESPLAILNPSHIDFRTDDANTGIFITGRTNLGANTNNVQLTLGQIDIINDDPAKGPTLTFQTLTLAQQINMMNLAGTMQWLWNGVLKHQFTINNIIAFSGFQSGNPNGAGTAGVWKMGKIKAGAVALDAANYIEVNIDGTVKKVLIST